MTLDDLYGIAARTLLALAVVGAAAACVCFCRAVDPKDCATLQWHCLAEPDAGPQESTATLEDPAPHFVAHHRLECFP